MHSFFIVYRYQGLSLSFNLNRNNSSNRPTGSTRLIHCRIIKKNCSNIIIFSMSYHQSHNCHQVCDSLIRAMHSLPYWQFSCNNILEIVCVIFCTYCAIACNNVEKTLCIFILSLYFLFCSSSELFNTSNVNALNGETEREK